MESHGAGYVTLKRMASDEHKKELWEKRWMPLSSKNTVLTENAKGLRKSTREGAWPSVSKAEEPWLPCESEEALALSLETTFKAKNKCLQ